MYRMSTILLLVTVVLTMASTSRGMAQDASNEATFPSTNTTTAISTTIQSTAAPSTIVQATTSRLTSESRAYQIFDIRIAEIEDIDGTIISNRSGYQISFFLEGTIYTLDPSQGISLGLPRSASMLSLYGCNSLNTINQNGCYWDAYLLEQDGYYEIISGAEAGQATNLILQEVETKPIPLVWIQNRTDASETIIYDDKIYEIQPASIEEFTIIETTSPIFYLKNCLIIDEETVCEWVAQAIETDRLYSLVQEISAGSKEGQVRTVILKPIRDLSEEVKEKPQFTCNTQVPVVNVRSGPGLEYVVIAKLRQTDKHGGTIQVIGRDETRQWLAVASEIETNGWVTSNSNYIECSGDIDGLDEIPVLDGRISATATPTRLLSTSTPYPTSTAYVIVVPSPTPLPYIPEPTRLILPTPLYQRHCLYPLYQRHCLCQLPLRHLLYPTYRQRPEQLSQCRHLYQRGPHCPHGLHCPHGHSILRLRLTRLSHLNSH